LRETPATLCAGSRPHATLEITATAIRRSAIWGVHGLFNQSSVLDR
jgi:hypothetical protein